MRARHDIAEFPDRLGAAARVAPLRRAPAGAVAEVVAEMTEMGLLDELRAALEVGEPRDAGDALRAVRDLVYELAGARNRDLAVDVLIYATGIAEFDLTSLRDYARTHGLSPEGFRKHVIALQRRLGLPPRPMQHQDAI